MPKPVTGSMDDEMVYDIIAVICGQYDWMNVSFPVLQRGAV